MSDPYVHGHGDAEAARLHDQARTLEDLLHGGTRLPAGSAVLEVGCGAGAQTVALVRRNPGIALLAVDVSAEAVRRTRALVQAAGPPPVAVEQASLFDLPGRSARYDHVFACFVLEHVASPLDALAALRAVLKPGGTLTAIEGDHGSVRMHPEDPAARHAVACQVELQARAGGDAMLGRRLGPLLRQAGFADVRVDPRTVHADAERPDLMRSFTLGTFTAMVAGVRDAALAAGLTDAPRFEAGLRALRRAAEPGGSFSYTFFKAVGRAP